MELADPRSHKMLTKLYKISKFGVKSPNSKQDTAILKCQNLQRNAWPSRRCLITASKQPITTVLHTTSLMVILEHAIPNAMTNRHGCF